MTTIRGSLDSVSLADLQAAMLLTPSAEIHCLASMENNGSCNGTVNFSSSDRDDILSEISNELAENGSIKASTMIPTLLTRLAGTLKCDQHDNKESRVPCKQTKHVSRILLKRLESFQDTQRARMQGKEGRLRNEAVSKVTQDDKQIGKGKEKDLGRPMMRRRSMRLRPEVDSDGSDELAFKELEPASARRPRLPSNPTLDTGRVDPFLSAQSRPFVTPNKPGRQRQPFRAPKAENGDVETPGTDVPAVFSQPASAASSISSAASAPYPNTRSSRRKSSQQQVEETPLKCRAGRRKSPSVSGDSGSEYEDPGDGSDGSSSGSGTPTNHDDSESEAAFTENEDDVFDSNRRRRSGNKTRQPRGQDRDHENQSGVMSHMAFQPMKTKPTSPVAHLLDTMLRRIKNSEPGYVYCFADTDVPGYLKIGFAGLGDNQESEPLEVLPLVESSPERHRLGKRLQAQVSKCKFDMELKYAQYMPCAGHRIERLVHATFPEQRKTVTSCKTPQCGIKHNEWFNVSVEEARSAIEAWANFSRMEPWTELGRLRTTWHNYAAENEGNFTGWSVQAWMNGPWKEFLGKDKREKELRSTRAEIEGLKKKRLEADAEMLRLKLESNLLKQEQLKILKKKTRRELDQIGKELENAEAHAAELEAGGITDDDR